MLEIGRLANTSYLHAHVCTSVPNITFHAACREIDSNGCTNQLKKGPSNGSVGKGGSPEYWTCITVKFRVIKADCNLSSPKADLSWKEKVGPWRCRLSAGILREERKDKNASGCTSVVGHLPSRHQAQSGTAKD